MGKIKAGFYSPELTMELTRELTRWLARELRSRQTRKPARE
jgi:hypothetical protein